MKPLSKLLTRMNCYKWAWFDLTGQNNATQISFFEKCQMIDRENGLVVLSFIFTEDIKVAQYQNDWKNVLGLGYIK